MYVDFLNEFKSYAWIFAARDLHNDIHKKIREQQQARINKKQNQSLILKEKNYFKFFKITLVL
jgi:hypothetical protein